MVDQVSPKDLVGVRFPPALLRSDNKFMTETIVLTEEQLEAVINFAATQGVLMQLFGFLRELEKKNWEKSGVALTL